MTKKILSNQVTSSEIEIVIRELKKVIKNNIIGDVVEFGCYLGTTSVYIADILAGTNLKFYVYDSFEGLPEKTFQDYSPVGDQFKPGELLAPKKQFIKNIIQSGVPMPIIKKAWFSELKSNDLHEKVAFVFLDGDYYASIIDPIKLLESKLISGAIVIVDDYNNEALPGASVAVNEWISKHKLKIRIEQSLAILKIP